MAHLERIVVEKFYAGDCFGDKLSFWDFSSTSAAIIGFVGRISNCFISDHKNYEHSTNRLKQKRISEGLAKVHA